MIIKPLIDMMTMNEVTITITNHVDESGETYQTIQII